jgi:hypothetical protein
MSLGRVSREGEPEVDTGTGTGTGRTANDLVVWQAARDFPGRSTQQLNAFQPTRARATSCRCTAWASIRQVIS